MTGSRRSGVVMDPAETTRVLVPPARLRSRLTATPDLFVIAHMGIARVPLEGWSLAIEGAVERPRRIGYDELLAMPLRTVTSVHECYGNPIEPDVPTRRVANVRWTGVPLAAVLEAAGPHPGSSHVWLEGADWGTFAGIASDRYAKDLPLETARDPDVLLAWGLNEAPLSPEHGFPVRVVVPGWFGTCSVKWLTRIRVAGTALDGFFTTTLYNREVVVDGVRQHRPARELDVQAILVRPVEGDALPAGPQTLAGWAWSAHDVVAVEISVDGGATWTPARLEPRAVAHTWQRFTADWDARPGRHTLRCRATDAAGRTQPATGRNQEFAITVTAS